MGFFSQKRSTLRLALLGIFVLSSGASAGCGSSSGKDKEETFLQIRDLRYSRELAIEVLEPQLGRISWWRDNEIYTAEDSIDVRARIRDPQAHVTALANGQEYEVEGPNPQTGEFFVRNIPLQPGENQVVLSGRRNTRSNEMRFSVHRREKAPIAIESPSDGAFVEARWIEVRGYAAPGIEQIQVNGIAARRDPANPSQFIATGVIVDDGKNTIEVLGKDDDGNRWRATATVERDVTPPQITLKTPEDDSVVNFPEIVFEGSVNEKSLLTLNGKRVEIDENGHFRVTAAVEGVEKRFVLEARDGANNASQLVRRVRVDTSRPGLRVLQPDPGTMVTAYPLEFRVHSSKVPATVEIRFDGEKVGETALHEEMIRYQLPDPGVPDGEHRVLVRLIDEAGNTAEYPFTLTTDTKGPNIEFRGIADGATLENTKVDVAVTDPSLVRSSIRMTLNGKPISQGEAISYRKNGSGQKVLRVEAADRHGNRSVQEVTFYLGRDPLVGYVDDVWAMWNADARRKRNLVDPLMADLRKSGTLPKVKAAYARIARDLDARPARPSNSRVIQGFRAFEAVFPEPYRSEAVRQFYQAQRDLSTDGIYLDLAEVFAHAGRIEASDVIDRILLLWSEPDAKGHAVLTDIVLILDQWARYPKRDRMFAALTNLPDLDLDWNPRTKNDMFDIPLDFLSAFFDLPESDFRALIDYQAKIAEKGAYKIGPRVAHELIDRHHGESYVSAAYEPLQCVLSDRTDRAYDRMLRAWGGFINAYVNDPDTKRRQMMTEGVLKFLKESLREDVLHSTATVINYKDLPALHEAFQVLSRQEVFDKALTDVGKIMAAKDNDGRSVIHSMLIAFDGFFETDEVHPNQTYAETMLDGVERILQRDANGVNSLEIVIDVFLDKLTHDQRMRMGEIFKYHTLPGGKKVLAKGRQYPSDNVRLLKLMDTAYSPLNCGMPIAFTDIVVPINLPGIPIKFPTENLAVASFEASAEMDAASVERFARAFDFLVRMASLGDMFCEPDILSELVADPDPIRALLKDTPLTEMFVMIQALAERGDAPYLVEMIHSLYLSGAAGLFDPTMNAVFEQGVFENFVSSLQQVRDTPIPSDPNRRALSVFLDAAAHVLRTPPGKRERTVRPYLMLVDRMISDDYSRVRTEAFFEWVAQVLNNPPEGVRLQDLDNIAGEITGCDKEGKATRALARLIDEDPGNGDLVRYIPHAREYVSAPPDLAIAFNRMLSKVLENGTVTTSLHLLQRWLEYDQKYDNVLQDSLDLVLKPNRNDNAPLDPAVYGLVHTAAPVVKEERTRIRRILEPQNRFAAHRVMRYPFNAMRMNKRVGKSYMEQIVPAGRQFFDAKNPKTGDYYLNDVVLAAHVLIEEAVVSSGIEAHEVAWNKGHYDVARTPDVLEGFADVMEVSLSKWNRQASTQ